MARFPDGFIDEVRASCSIIGIISGYIPLRKAGTSHKGLCPFHSEKTPSFNVSEDRGIFHCFGCGEGGDVFRFIMNYEKVPFPESVRRVATLSGIPLPETVSTPGGDKKERLYRLNEAALDVYRKTLTESTGAAARSYLNDRGIDDEAIERFELGVTPEGWQGVSRPLGAGGYRPEEVVEVGLAKRRPSGDGIYDRFHDRIIFPIRNATGRLVGFGGRSFAGQDPKYLNSPETPLYHKSDVLYGFYGAKETVRKGREVVVVEGYLDQIALVQHGVEGTVACLGTSLTESHARLLSRFADKLYLAYDGDLAGKNAVKRALKTLLRTTLEIAIVEVKDGMDPDDLVRSQGGDAFRQCMKEAQGFVPFLLRQGREARGDGATGAEARVRLVNEVLPFLALLDDPVERAAQVALLAESCRLDDGVIRDALKRAATERRHEIPLSSVTPTEVRATATPGEAEGLLIVALLEGDGDRDGLWTDLTTEDTGGLVSEAIFLRLFAAREAGVETTVAALLSELSEARDREILGEVAMRHEVVTVEQGKSALAALRQGRLRQALKDIQQQVRGLEGGELDELLLRKQELSRLLDRLT